METSSTLPSPPETNPPLDEAFWTDLLERRTGVASLNTLDPMQRIDLLKHGFPAPFLDVVSAELGIDKTQLYRVIGIARATADRKVRQEKTLSQDESEKVLGLASLVGQVEQVVAESGVVEDFNAAKWTAAFLDQPHPALGGRKPGELMDSAEGRGVVSDLVARMQSGAYG